VAFGQTCELRTQVQSFVLSLWILAFAVVIPGLLVGLVVLWGSIALRTKTRAESIGDMLIVAAHPDDCVIMAGEMAIDSARLGHSVQVVYLTCGDANAASERALTRRRESVVAWAMAGVPESALHYCGLSESTMGSPLRASDIEVDRARQRILLLVSRLPLEAAVVVPADGETHIDHRMAREVALQAIANSGRTDLRTLETPEYNDYYSLPYSPMKTLRYVVGLVPVLRRGLMRSLNNPAEGFVDGGPGWRLSPDPDRLLQKKSMLRAFRSEDGELLVRLFGRPDFFRPIHNVGSPQRLVPRAFVKLGHRRLAPSVVLLWLWVFTSSVGLLAVLGRTVYLGRHPTMQFVALCGAVLFAAYAFLGKHPLETRLVSASLALGLLIAASL
jgi:LmbE family N-acetylglucosaminyl deacetylase